MRAFSMTTQMTHASVSTISNCHGGQVQLGRALHSGAPSSRCHSCVIITGTLSKNPHLVRSTPADDAANSRWNEYHREDCARGHDSPLHPRRNGQPKNGKEHNPQKRTCKQATCNAKIAAEPWLWRGISLVNKQEKTRYPGNRATGRKTAR